MDKELLRKLDERLAKGEISEELYKEIKSRYEEDELEEEEMKEIEEEEMEEMEEEMEYEELHEETGKKRRVSISGISKIDGCTCEIFKASGASKVSGDLKAEEATISGATKISGDAEFGKVKASGSLKVSGDTKAEEMNLSGASKFDGDVKGEKINASGSTKFSGDVEAEEFIGSGSFKVSGNLKSDTYTSTGVFKIGGTLKANEITIKPAGDCAVDKIIGGDILVEKGGSGIFSLGSTGNLKVDKMKGDSIYLENTIADYVEGETVKIGPGCKIYTVKAKNLKVHESSTVNNKKKLD